ncbi:MAG: hypothetical protein ACI9TY_001056 [Alphaproteobacteria bacterium]|jgi:hypothetical protein
MSDKITTLGEFLPSCVILKSITDNDEAMKNIDGSIHTAKTRGMPNPDEYSLQNITASDKDDLNLKMHLVIIPISIQLANQEITMEAFISLYKPLWDAILAKILKKAKYGGPIAGIEALDYPITITAA